MRSFEFIWTDVFTREPYLGNQLAVFTDAAGLSSEEMQRLAKETNLSETTFILRRDAEVEQRDGIRVRIFTTQEELPFAGHPTLGTAAVLRQILKQDEIVLDLNAGKVPVNFESADGAAFGEMRPADPSFLGTLPRDEVAQALGIEPEALDKELPVEMVSTGLAFAMVPFRSLEVLQKLQMDLARATRYLSGHPAKFFYLVCTETGDSNARLHARMIFYNGEDPATGSAAGCCAAWMAKHGVAGSGEQVMIEQGVECGRRSSIFVRADISPRNEVVNVRVGGHVSMVGSGRFDLL
jgi:trans-2,3-dihydro-3-hydroxyanthranilate isomerase